MFSKKNLANNLIHLKWVLHCIVIYEHKHTYKFIQDQI